MVKIYACLFIALSPVLLKGQPATTIPFRDIWTVFNTRSENLEAFMQQKGYLLSEKKPLLWMYKHSNTHLSANISFNYYDSSRISGISFEVKNEQTAATLKDLGNNTFVKKDSTAMPAPVFNYNTQREMEFESARYMLFCAITSAYPKKELASIRYSWHDLITQSLVVVKKGNNPYLTEAVLAHYETMSLDTFKMAKENTLSMVSEKAVFKGRRSGMYIYLNDNIRYPEAALKDSIQGFITVRFTVDKSGKAKNATIINGNELGHGIPEEVIRLVNAMPLWKPALELNRIVESTIEQRLILKIQLNNLL